MKILCVIDSLGSGGAQRQLVGLAIGLREKGHDLSFLVYHDINFFKDWLDDADIHVFSVIEPNYLKRLYKMRKYIRESNPDAVLSFLEASNFICEIAGLPWRRWKLVVGERSANPAILSSNKRKAFRCFHLIADYVVSNSFENMKMIRKANPFLRGRNCKVIFNIVDTEKFTPAKDYIPLGNGKLNIVVAASHQYLKNAKGLIEAVRDLEDECKRRLKIDWYGDESPDNSFCDSNKMIREYNLQDIFSFHKATKGIAEKLQYADVVGLFSFYEGLPNVVCEAMVLGKFIISSKVSDIPQLLKSYQTCTFNPNKVEEIRRTLLYVLSLTKGELIKMGEENREVALSLFNKNSIIEDYENILI